MQLCRPEAGRGSRKHRSPEGAPGGRPEAATEVIMTDYAVNLLAGPIVTDYAGMLPRLMLTTRPAEAGSRRLE